ncbi:MAG: hypothetical protein P4M14_01780 [Gammaproteobacteria bacterium]|nr:hypothetical protein [Gammaproteobacteria bacterium]
MNGFKLKSITAPSILLIMAFLSSLSFATSASTSAKIYGTKMGCMSCHQGASIPPEKVLKKTPRGEQQDPQADK